VLDGVHAAEHSSQWSLMLGFPSTLSTGIPIGQPLQQLGVALNFPMKITLQCSQSSEFFDHLFDYIHIRSCVLC